MTVKRTRKREIVLPPGTEWVLAVDVPHMLALALYPRGSDSPDAEDFDPNTDPVVLAGILRFDAEDQHREFLQRCVLMGQVQVLGLSGNPSSWGNQARMSIDVLRAYADQFHIKVRKVAARNRAREPKQAGLPIAPIPKVEP